MRAMVLIEPKKPLQMMEIPIPQPETGQVLIQVAACGVCRTDLHVYDGELPHPKLPLILGHQIVGTIVAQGPECHHFALGQRVGVPWLGRSCGKCPFCRSGQENLCDYGVYTGYQLNGGFAEFCTAYEDFIFPIPDDYSSAHAAPLLCAGLIGYRTLRLAGEGKRLGFYGFGAAAIFSFKSPCIKNVKFGHLPVKGTHAHRHLLKAWGLFGLGTPIKNRPFLSMQL